MAAGWGGKHRRVRVGIPGAHGRVVDQPRARGGVRRFHPAQTAPGRTRAGRRRSRSSEVSERRHPRRALRSHRLRLRLRLRLGRDVPERRVAILRGGQRVAPRGSARGTLGRQTTWRCRDAVTPPWCFPPTPSARRAVDGPGVDRTRPSCYFTAASARTASRSATCGSSPPTCRISSSSRPRPSSGSCPNRRRCTRAWTSVRRCSSSAARAPARRQQSAMHLDDSYAIRRVIVRGPGRGRAGRSRGMYDTTDRR